MASTLPVPLAAARARSLPIPEAATHPVVVRAGCATVVAAEPAEVVSAHGDEALEILDRLDGWWAGFLAYDLGRSVERVHPHHRPGPHQHPGPHHRPGPRDALPDLLLARYDARLVLDDDPSGPARFEGRAGAIRRLERRLESARRPRAPRELRMLGSPRSSATRAEFEAGVRAIVALIEAGDCYQVNLTRQLGWDLECDPVDLAHAVRAANPAPHESLLVLPRSGAPSVAIVSASPERYLSWQGDRVETRPIKGTHRDAASLLASAKDAAEHVMIVDLARNDLGRVCEYGSVAVEALEALERHPGLFHLVSTVRGRLRPGTGLGDLVRATFPAASITGAPKPRVLQAIEDLEACRRGVYCGAVGWIDADRGTGDLSLAIRTFAIHDGATRLGVGAGIVADSDPATEWDETELKVARLLGALGHEVPGGNLDIGRDAARRQRQGRRARPRPARVVGPDALGAHAGP